MADWRKGVAVVSVDNQPRYFILLIRDNGVIEDVAQRHVGQRHLRRHSLGGALRATPASTSPDRAGVAFASSVFRLSKRYVECVSVVRYTSAPYEAMRSWGVHGGGGRALAVSRNHR